MGLLAQKAASTTSKILTLFFWLLALGFVSCKTLGINQNGYADLTPSQKESIRSFSVETVNNLSTFPKDSVVIEEITANEIELLANQYPYIWVHEFVPSCSNLHTAELKALLELEKNHKNELKLVLISAQYNLQDIRYIFHFFGQPTVVYLLHHTDYPTTTGKASRTLFKQLKATNKKKSLKGCYFDDYILHRSQLVNVRPWKQPLPKFIVDVERTMLSGK